jgi:glucose-1-phosphate cytidylyltransferase
MKVVILAGGFGTRISEESHLRPKPMVEIGGAPILWHIMKSYLYYGYTDFIICAGYKQSVIKEYFAHYYIYNSDVTFDFRNGQERTYHTSSSEPWKVTVVDTGLKTMTGGRIKRIRNYVGNEPFMVTYGDGVCDLDIDSLVSYHRQKGSLATVTAVHPEGRFGSLCISDDGNVTTFAEKRREDSGWINGGFMVFEPSVFDYIEGDNTILEREPLERLSQEGRLTAYRYDGFWQCMDTMRDRQQLDELVSNQTAPWIKWD